MANWNSSPSWTYFDNINGGQQFSNMLSPEDFNALAENIAYLYEHQGENEYLGAYAGGNYRVGAIVKYSDGNIYRCIKDTDDEQEPTNAEYWQMLNEVGSGEDIPEISKPLTLMASKEGAEEGELVVAYNLSEKVALPTGTNKPLGFLKDENYIPSNIKKDVYLFGLKGEYEGEGSGGGDGEFPADKYFEGGYAEVNLPNATKIKPYAFYQDTRLVNISMPKVTSIDYYAFSGCTKLALTKLPSAITSIGEKAFQECRKLALTELPSGITSIGASTFSSCYELALTELPSGITSIGDRAFSECSKLAIEDIPSGVTNIGLEAFNRCTSIVNITLPSGLKTGYNAFGNCTSLKSVTFKGNPTSLYHNTFNSCSNLTTINVPWAEGAVANAPWGATKATINYNYTGE